ncbi:cytochrome c biogenesis protein ResB [Thermodesulfobacteriota bacterium]
MQNTGSPSNPLDLVWDFFSSVKLTVVVLVVLALTSIIGTLIPQNQNPAEYIRAFGEFYYRIFHVLDIFDMYHAWWFQLLLMLLTVNITVCSIDRLSAVWKIVFVKIPAFNISRFRRIGDSEAFSVQQSSRLLESLYEPVISRHFHHSRIETTDNGIFLFAEKGRWTRLGVYVVHLSVILLLLGGLIGSMFGFDGFVNVPEGESISSIRLRQNNTVFPLNFSVRCDDFSVSFYDNGTPSEYRSTLTIVEDGSPVLTKDIIVNDPLRYKGINLFQSSYGKLEPQQIVLSFESADSGMKYNKTVTFKERIDLPEKMGWFEIRDYHSAFNFRGQNIGEAFMGILKQENKAAVNILLPTQFPEFDKMRKGNPTISIVDVTSRYYTGLQVTKDPGVWIVYLGFILMIAGCFVTFFMSHQRFCVEIVPKGETSDVTVAGFANKNVLGMQQKVKRMADKLKTVSSSHKEDPRGQGS